MIKRILIVRTDRLGDLVATLPMATAIKAREPHAKVIMMVRSYTAPLLSLTSDIDEIVLFDPNATLQRKIELFRSVNADVVFFPTPKPELAMWGAFARIARRVGTAYRWYSPFFTDKIYDHRKTAEHHESEYNVRMLGAIGVPASPTPLPKLVLHAGQLKAAQDLLSTICGSANQPFAVLHLGTGGSSQEWPTTSFTALGVLMAQRLSLPLLLTGTEGERERIFSVSEQLRAAGASTFEFIGYNLIQLSELLSRAAVVVAGSTGPGHLAAALGAPTVGLFPLSRAISKERWGFRGPKVVNLAPVEAPFVSCPMCKDCTCIRQIAVEEVFGAVQQVMSF